ncbi:MAG: aconitate hydratase AcnA [Planctomycetes bacterium]|nr:aconitate hydratase AcnA [Planctomycetota bacterium]
MPGTNPFASKSRLKVGNQTYTYYSLQTLAQQIGADLTRLPYSIRVLLEQALRNHDDYVVSTDDVKNIANWGPSTAGQVEIPFLPGRVVLQDFTGVPCVVDLAAMRAAMRRLGGNPDKINPLVPCDLVIDHSVQVDAFASKEALQQNLDLEFERNRERYEFLKWGQQSLTNFRVVPPGMGIVHQVNLEYLATAVLTKKDGNDTIVYPDTVVGTDSHTTMINGLGVLGWGVGGIEAEAVMLGQPTYMLLPEVVGMELKGRLPEGATATDLVLTVTEILRKAGVVNKFVEFFGEGIGDIPLADRATIANMAPEYGATMGFFPVDEETCRFLGRTGRDAQLVDLVRSYYQAQGMFWIADARVPEYTSRLSLDLATVVPSLAGPKRPQDRVALSAMQPEFAASLKKPVDKRGFALAEQALGATATVAGSEASIGHGAVVIAAITSCTNTSNPSVMIGAGLLAKKAAARGLTRKSWVKTSLAPGSRVVTDYLTKAGLLPHLEAVGFHVIGYGCTTCIGNSGPLPAEVSAAIKDGNLVAAAVLSGNRNFEGRVNPDVKANYLASPPLVVAYALAGTVDIDLANQPLGTDRQGQPVFLRDIWPTQQEIADAMAMSMSPKAFRQTYATVADGPPAWRKITAKKSDLFAFDQKSTYIQDPPFFQTMARTVGTIAGIANVRALAVLGDSVTTDHISPAGNIKKDSPAGRYLIENGVEPKDFNQYGARRGNDRVMTRGTFANIRLRNFLVEGEGGLTKHLPSGETMAIWDAAQRYQQDGTALCVLAGKEYGTGSSRDWAAKGTFLLGVKFVLAESYERIHRSNLVGMGVLPLQYLEGQTRESLGLTGTEVFSVAIDDSVEPRQKLTVTATDATTGESRTFEALCRIDTPVEVDYYRNGGILQTVLRKLLGGGKAAAPKPGVKVKSKPVAAPAATPAVIPVAKKPAPVKTAPVKKAVVTKPAKKTPAKKLAKKPAAKPTRPTKKVAKKPTKPAKPAKKAPPKKVAKKPTKVAKPMAKKAAAKGKAGKAARPGKGR